MQGTLGGTSGGPAITLGEDTSLQGSSQQQAGLRVTPQQTASAEGHRPDGDRSSARAPAVTREHSGQLSQPGSTAPSGDSSGHASGQPGGAPAAGGGTGPRHSHGEASGSRDHGSVRDPSAQDSTERDSVADRERAAGPSWLANPLYSQSPLRVAGARQEGAEPQTSGPGGGVLPFLTPLASRPQQGSGGSGLGEQVLPAQQFVAVEGVPLAVAKMADQGDVRIPQIPRFDGSQAKWAGYQQVMGGVLRRLRLLCRTVSQEELLRIIMHEAGVTEAGVITPYQHWLKRIVPAVIEKHKSKLPEGAGEYKGQAYTVQGRQVPDLLDTWWDEVEAEYQKPDPQALLELRQFARGKGKGVSPDESVPDALSRFMGIHQRILVTQMSEHEQSLHMLDGINLPGVETHVVQEGQRSKVLSYSVSWAYDQVKEFYDSCLATSRLLPRTNPEAAKVLGLLPASSSSTVGQVEAGVGHSGGQVAGPTGSAQPRALATAELDQYIARTVAGAVERALVSALQPERLQQLVGGRQGAAAQGGGVPYGCTEPGCPAPHTQSHNPSPEKKKKKKKNAQGAFVLPARCTRQIHKVVGGKEGRTRGHGGGRVLAAAHPQGRAAAATAAAAARCSGQRAQQQAAGGDEGRGRPVGRDGCPGDP